MLLHVRVSWCVLVVAVCLLFTGYILYFMFYFIFLQITADICHDPDGTVLSNTGNDGNSGTCLIYNSSILLIQHLSISKFASHLLL